MTTNIPDVQGRKVIPDPDLAVFYKVKTQQLIPQVERSFKRLTNDSNCKLTRQGYRRKLPKWQFKLRGKP